jgi:hypothetical protein
MSAYNNKNSRQRVCKLHCEKTLSSHPTVSPPQLWLSPAPRLALAVWLFLGAAICAAMPLNVLAAANADADIPPTQNGEISTGQRWFQVELILFSQLGDAALDAEKWPVIEGLSLPEPLLELHLPESPVTDQTGLAISGPSALSNESAISTITEPGLDIPAADTPELPPAFQMLAEDKRQLNDMAKRIKRSSKLHLLLHIAWQQPTLDREHAVPVYLVDGMTDPLPVETPMETIEATKENGGTSAAVNPLPLTPQYATEEDAQVGPPNPEFAGTVTLSVERYLHIATDLVYRRPVTQHMPIPISNLDLWYDRPYPSLQEPQGPAYQQISWQAIRGFRLKESRRMRSTEIHYLDHPFMGMVVVITPVELPEPAEHIQKTLPQNILSTPAKSPALR